MIKKLGKSSEVEFEFEFEFEYAIKVFKKNNQEDVMFLIGCALFVVLFYIRCKDGVVLYTPRIFLKIFNFVHAFRTFVVRLNKNLEFI